MFCFCKRGPPTSCSVPSTSQRWKEGSGNLKVFVGNIQWAKDDCCRLLDDWLCWMMSSPPVRDFVFFSFKFVARFHCFSNNKFMDALQTYQYQPEAMTVSISSSPSSPCQTHTSPERPRRRRQFCALGGSALGFGSKKLGDHSSLDFLCLPMGFGVC